MQWGWGINMLHGLQMQRATFHLMTDEVPRAALELASTGCFSPDMKNITYRETLTSVPAQEYRELYHSAHNHFEKIYQHLDIKLPMPPLNVNRIPEVEELRDIEAWLVDLWAECSECEEHQRETDEEIQLISSLQKSLHNFYGLDINLDQLRHKKAFLDLRVGVVPVENLSRLKKAASLAGYIIEVFHKEKLQYHVLIAGLLGEDQENIQSVLHAAGYRTFPIPEAFHDTPDNLRDELIKRHDELLVDKQKHMRKRIIKVNEYIDDILSCRRILKLVEPTVSLGTATWCKGSLAVIHGWIPEIQFQEVSDQLREALEHPIHIDSHTPTIDEYDEVPTVIRYPRWLMPFVTLTRSYGTPRYGEIDPTWLFAISSIILFGMMFGDVGHGATLLIAAIIFRKLIKQFSILIAANGISSMGFGLLYGSIFGNEHLITPVWQSPLHDPTTVLLIAVYIGVCFVSLSILINIYNHISLGNYRRALSSPGGLPGLMILSGLYLSFVFSHSTSVLLLLPVLIIMAALAVMAHYLWQTNSSPVHERAIIVSIELFETFLSLVSNVLSFLRVGAFSLNHVALMLAVFTISEMLPASGYWPMMIVGNLFVISFEAAIVMIQVLRLEYYEGLSRYFNGDGKVFEPLQLVETSTRYRLI